MFFILTALAMFIPDASWNDPAGHVAHSELWGELVNVPGAQGVADVEPVAHAEPGGQSVHSPEPVRLAVFEKVPAGHGSGADAPSGQ